MALDGIYLYSLVEDLKKSIINSKIDKINQPEKDEIILTLRKDRKNLKLLISSSPKYPRLHLTDVAKTNPLQAPMFTMVMRKYLIGGKIVNIEQISGDRLVKISIEASDELGFNSIYFLFIEIMGRHSNISLVRERDCKIMECIKHIGSDINSFRTLYPGTTYKFPPKSQKLNPFSFSIAQFIEYININNVEFNKHFFQSVFTGVSNMLSEHLFISYNNSSNYDTNNLYNFITTFINSLEEMKKFTIYKNFSNNYVEFYNLPLLNLENQYELLCFDNPHTLMDNYYIEKDKQERIKNRSLNLNRLIHTNIDRCLKKEEKLNSLLDKCLDKEGFRIKGDLLTSYIYTIKKGDTKVIVPNFFSENQEDITIFIDENKTPSENIQALYKKYNKLKKSEESALEQLDKNKEELDYLYSVLTNIENCENYVEIEDIKNELISTGYIKKKRSTKIDKKSKTSKPLHFLSSEGIDIYVGKNNIQNDYLSLKFANKNFLWLHTKNIPGSHVIVCSAEILDKTLEEAAVIAAYYSKAQTSSKVPVDYTKVKNLKKPNGSKPGMVIYHTNYTMYAEPSEYTSLNIQKL